MLIVQTIIQTGSDFLLQLMELILCFPFEPEGWFWSPRP